MKMRSTQASSHRFSSMNSIRRATERHWQMLPPSSPSSASSSAIVKPWDWGGGSKHRSISTENCNYRRENKALIHAALSPRSHAFLYFVLQDRIYLICMICRGASSVLFFVFFAYFHVILQDSLTFLWQVNALAKNNVQALLIGYTTAPPSGRENQLTEEFGSVNPNWVESRLLRLMEACVAGKKCECRCHPLLFENMKHI